ncbi:hypothetical protein [Streptomyces sp. NPDC005125]
MTQPTPTENVDGAAIAALMKVIAALGASDPKTFYASAEIFERVGSYLTTLSGAILEQSRKLFGTEGEGWQGEGAAAVLRILNQYRQYLDTVAPLVLAWPEPLRSAGESLQQTWYDVDAILAKYADASATPATPQEQAVPAETPRKQEKPATAEEEPSKWDFETLSGS